MYLVVMMAVKMVDMMVELKAVMMAEYLARMWVDQMVC